MPSLLHGIDVSRWQGRIDWTRVASTRRVDFAYVKISEGASVVDSYADRNLKGARDAGLRVGAYHYLSASSDSAGQAARFLAAYARERSDLPPALDVEVAGPGEVPSALVSRVLAWLRVVEEGTGTIPLLYTFPAFAAAHLRCPEAAALAGYPLWIAHYGVSKPTVPDPWSDWAVWQHRSDERVDGVPTGVDADCMRVPTG